MKKKYISETFFYTKTRDRIGGTIRTEVFFEDGLYKAYSQYWQDQDDQAIGFAESTDEEKSVKQSRKSLRKEWIEYKGSAVTKK